MARLTAPLFSQEARKKLAGLKVYQKRLGRSRAIKYSKPYQKNPRAPSPGQLDQRMIYNLTIARWQTMTDGEKAPYIAAVEAGRLSMSPWNYFLKESRRDLYTHLGLAGYWSFNRIVSGKVLDLSGNENDGTPKPSYPDNCPQLVPGLGGKFGQAMSFDGIDDHIDCGHSNSLNIAEKITVEIWTKPETLSNFKTWISKLASSLWLANGYGLSYIGGMVGFYVTHFSWGGVNVARSSIAEGVWSHIVGTYDEQTLRIYVNGIEGTPNAYTDGIITNTNPLSIGSGGGIAHNIHALIDEARIYNRVLGLPEILKHYEIYSKYK